LINGFREQSSFFPWLYDILSTDVPLVPVAASDRWTVGGFAVMAAEPNGTLISIQ
jgi:hypothetical protein